MSLLGNAISNRICKVVLLRSSKEMDLLLIFFSLDIDSCIEVLYAGEKW